MSNIYRSMGTALASIRGLLSEETLTESHFKMGQKVKCNASGKTGTVVAIDPDQTGKYYTVKRDDGEEMKYAPDELSAYGEVKEAPEDNEPASPDEGSMAMQQLEFIAYAAEEIKQHISGGGKFPEWMQNKLASTNDNMQSLHANINHDELDETMVRGKEVFDKTFANKKQADAFAAKNGGRVKQVGRVFYVFKEDLDEAVKYPHMMYDPKTGKGVEAKSPEDHEKYAKMGYTHDKPEEMDEAVDAKKVTAYLVKKGSNPKDAEKMVGKHFKYATDKYRDSSVSKIADVIMSLGEESEIIDEGKSSTGYELYHKDFSSAMKHAYDFAKKKFGIEVDPKEIDDKVASGPRKPSKGKTNSYRLLGKDGKKAIQVQVYGMDDGKYELNMYKESVDITEGKYDKEAKKIATYAVKNGGIDKNDMMKVAAMLKKGDLEGAKKYTKDLDTDPRDWLMQNLPESKEETQIDEKSNFTPKEIKMAIGVASDKRYKGGNMTGAVKAIEKIKKGLSDHPQVAAVLRRQNETTEHPMFNKIHKKLQEKRTK